MQLTTKHIAIGAVTITITITTYAVLVTAVLYIASIELAALKQEKEVHNWKFFTCRTLLDDPQTRATMDVKWKREDAQLACKRAMKKASQ